MAGVNLECGCRAAVWGDWVAPPREIKYRCPHGEWNIRRYEVDGQRNFAFEVTKTVTPNNEEEMNG